MSRTITSYAAKAADKVAIKEIVRIDPVVGENRYERNRNGTAGRIERVWIEAYKARFSGRRRRRLYAEARKAKANIELPVRPSHDDAGDTAGFTCLYG